MGDIVEATRESFRELVADGLVLVDVWGPACAPCLALNPHVERIVGERQPLRAVKLEAPKARRICIELKVMGLPSFLLFKDGQEVARISHPTLSPARLEAWLDEALALPGPPAI